MALWICRNLKYTQEKSHWSVALNKKTCIFKLQYECGIQFYIYLLSVCECMRVCPDMHVQVKRQLEGLSSLLLPSRSWELNSGHQAKQQTPSLRFFKGDSCMYIDWKSSIVFLSTKKNETCYSICISALTEHIFEVYLYFYAKFWSSVAKISADNFFIRQSLRGAWCICTALCLSVIVWPSVHFRSQDGKDVLLVYSEISITDAAVLLGVLSVS